MEQVATIRSLQILKHSATKEITRMTTHATGTFEVKSWDEKPYNEIEGGARLTRASVAKSFKGDLEGEGTVEYLMVHSDDGSASFVGLERVVGRVGGRTGNFVLEHRGTFEGGTATVRWSVVPGSATGGLRGLRGEGGFSSGHAESYPFTFDYDFE